ncbi:BON domain-containing protein [Pseudomonas sp. R2.Fl]|nr:BON domain-containing protein [Pseudomonas sp. R2.Fl]
MKPQDARRELSGSPRHEDPADPRDFHAWSQTQGHDPGGYSQRHGGRERSGFSDYANPAQHGERAWSGGASASTRQEREQGRYAPSRSMGGMDWDEAQLEPYPGGYHYEDRRAGLPEPRSFRGRGPRGYTRSDERIGEDIHERLTDDPMLDAGDITVEVHEGQVTLGGQVEQRWLKHHAEDLVDACSGVRGIRNDLRVAGSN